MKTRDEAIRDWADHANDQCEAMKAWADERVPQIGLLMHKEAKG